jgi:hypothetical protein
MQDNEETNAQGGKKRKLYGIENEQHGKITVQDAICVGIDAKTEVSSTTLVLCGNWAQLQKDLLSLVTQHYLDPNEMLTIVFSILEPLPGRT